VFPVRYGLDGFVIFRRKSRVKAERSVRYVTALGREVHSLTLTAAVTVSALREKLTVSHLLRQFHAFQRERRFITSLNEVLYGG
jgi:hypothetical protein